MKRTVKKLFILCVFLMSMQAFGYDLTQVNRSYLYDPEALIKCKFRQVQSPEGLSVFVELKSDAIQALEWECVFLGQSNLSSVSHDTLSLYPDTLLSDKKRLVLQFDIEKTKIHETLIIHLEQNMNDHAFDFDVPLVTDLGFSTIYPKDSDGLPLFTAYSKKDTLDVAGIDGQFHVYSYSPQFGPASPPDEQIGAIVPTLNIDSSYYAQLKLTDLRDGFFYWLQQDTLLQVGFSVLKVPAYFPHVRRVEDLVGPMRYITTDKEYQSMTLGGDTKKAFERFWLETHGSQTAARTGIRNYFNKVQEANDLFTDYKEGWKTDRGIIYIVFGKPDKVFRTESSEVWEYTQGFTFEFIRFSTLFAPSYYALKRNKKYDVLWYNKVGEIRME